MADRHELQHHKQVNPDVHHEEKDVNVSFLAKFAITFVIVTVVIHVVLYFMFAWMEARSKKLDPSPISLVQPGEIRRPPGPNLQRLNTAPAIELQNMRDRENENLGLAPKAAPQQGSQKVQRIPIEEAMRLAVERGFPVRQGSTVTAEAETRGDSGAPFSAGTSPQIAPGTDTGFAAGTSEPGRNEAVRPAAVPGPPQTTATPARQEPNR